MIFLNNKIRHIFRACFFILICLLISSCWKAVDWEKEIYVIELDQFYFKGNNYSINKQKKEIGCDIKVSLLPQTLHGYKKTSHSGPYKIKIFVENQECAKLNLLEINIYSDMHANNLLFQKKGFYSFIEEPRLDIYYHIFDELIDTEFQKNRTIYVELIFLKRESQEKIIVIHQLNPKREKGKIKIPLFTT